MKKKNNRLIFLSFAFFMLLNLLVVQPVPVFAQAYPTYTTSKSTMSISGTASDNVNVARVSWTNDRGGGGDAVGTANWSITGIALQPGQNTIVVTVLDTNGNSTSGGLIVTYNPPISTPTPTPSVTPSPTPSPSGSPTPSPAPTASATPVPVINSGGGGGGGGGTTILIPTPASKATTTTITLNLGTGGNTTSLPVIISVPIGRSVSLEAGSLPPLTGPFLVGMQGNQVKILQQYLAKDPTIYPERTINGYYGPAVVKAVQLFQSKYNIVKYGTPETTSYGLAGPATRAKITQVLGGGGNNLSNLTTDAKQQLIAQIKQMIFYLLAQIQILLRAQMSSGR